MNPEKNRATEEDAEMKEPKQDVQMKEVPLDFKDRQNKRIEHLSGTINRAIG